MNSLHSVSTDPIHFVACSPIVMHEICASKQDETLVIDWTGKTVMDIDVNNLFGDETRKIKDVKQLLMVTQFKERDIANIISHVIFGHVFHIISCVIFGDFSYYFSCYIWSCFILFLMLYCFMFYHLFMFDDCLCSCLIIVHV